jgi:hypothetical protein
MGPDQVGQILNFPTSPRNSQDPVDVDGSSQATDPTTPSSDALAEVDRIFEKHSEALGQSAERRTHTATEHVRLREEFAAVSAGTIRPAMETFLERLRLNGGGGLVEERSGVEGAGVAPRIRLWMSLSGELIGRPRRDQHPYLQLDLDVTRQQVNLDEGDMWKGRGTSGPVGAWITSEITGAMVTESLLDVLRRAAS